MFSKTHRLARPDFILTKTKGKSTSFPHFSALILSNILGFNRFSVVISSKLHKHAVVRNNLRRRIYDCLANLPGSYDVILYPKKSMLNINSKELSDILSTIHFRTPPKIGGGNEGAV